MQISRTALLLAALMACASATGFVSQPSEANAPKPQFEDTIPKEFAGWRSIDERGLVVSNPEANELLRKLYGDLLSRIYVNKAGYRIMLSLAWGANQTGNLQAHLPTVCYAAQGFAVEPRPPADIATPFGHIDAARIATVSGARHEPVTYWLTNAGELVAGATGKRWAQIRMWLEGTIPDGMLFRVSSIDTDTDRAFAVQEQFVADLLANLDPGLRKRLSGLGPAVPVAAAGSPQLIE
jgi:EpsI family protein